MTALSALRLRLQKEVFDVTEEQLVSIVHYQNDNQVVSLDCRKTEAAVSNELFTAACSDVFTYRIGGARKGEGQSCSVQHSS